MPTPPAPIEMQILRSLAAEKAKRSGESPAAAAEGWRLILGQSEMAPHLWEALQSLTRQGYLEWTDARSGPLGVKTGEKMIRVSSAGLLALPRLERN